MAADEAGVHTTHPPEVRFGIVIEQAKLRAPPASAKVDSKAPIPCKRVPNPACPGTVFYDDDDPAVLLEVAHRNATSPARAPSDRLDNECVVPGVGGPWDPEQDGEVRSRVGDPDDGSRKSHGSLPRCPSGRRSATRSRADSRTVCRQADCAANRARVSMALGTGRLIARVTLRQ